MEIPINDDIDEKWEGCCSQSDSHFVKYLVQVIISAVILVFSITMIIIKKSDGCEVYFSIISAIMGIFSPSPTMNKSGR